MYLIKEIEANGHTYMAGGNLYYDISTYDDYGKLAAALQYLCFFIFCFVTPCYSHIPTVYPILNPVGVSKGTE